jgi:hypothetical protein
MDQPTAVTQPLEESNIPKYHTFEDDTTESSESYTLYNVCVDSDEGRAYAKLVDGRRTPAPARPREVENPVPAVALLQGRQGGEERRPLLQVLPGL